MARTFGDRSDNGDRNSILKKKVKFLERENARLRKELNKAYDALQYRDSAGEDAPQRKRERSAPTKQQCDKCGSEDLVSYELNVRGEEKRYVKCRSCGHNKSAKKKDV